MDIPPLMVTTPGITEPNLSREPLMDEGEATPGPDDANPFRSASEREIVEAYREKQREQRQRDIELAREREFDLDFGAGFQDPTAGDDPFAFDDVDDEIQDFQLPFADSPAPQF